VQSSHRPVASLLEPKERRKLAVSAGRTGESVPVRARGLKTGERPAPEGAGLSESW
jgi:hypothetical protein